MSRLLAVAAGAAIAAFSSGARADALAGQTEKEPLNLLAIGMFGFFVLLTLGITKWAAKRTTSAAQFYAAGGGITG
ncbi:MAG: cation acetate symporter, partial [Methylocystaceae bacterium]